MPPVDARAWWAHVAMRAIAGVEVLDPGPGDAGAWRAIRRLVPGGPPQAAAGAAPGAAVGGASGAASGAAAQGARGAPGAAGLPRPVVAGAGTTLVRAEVRVPVVAPGVPAELALDVPEAGLPGVRCWIGLDVAGEVEEARAVLSADPLLGPMVAAHPALPLPGTPDGAELALRTVLGQQVSVAAARTLAARLAVLVADAAAAQMVPGDAGRGGGGCGAGRSGGGGAGGGGCGGAGPAGAARTDVAPADGAPGTLMPFPPAAAVAAIRPEALRALGLTGARATTLHVLAAAITSGLQIGPATDHAVVRAELLALPGIGPWTVEYVALRALRDLDAFPASDLVLRRAMGVTTPAEALRVAERWRPWRGVAAQHLWTSLSAP